MEYCLTTRGRGRGLLNNIVVPDSSGRLLRDRLCAPARGYDLGRFGAEGPAPAPGRPYPMIVAGR